MRTYRPDKKNTELFRLMDKLHECNEEISFYGIGRKHKRLDQIEKNAIEVEKIAYEMQELIKTMRRKCHK
ncbi:hypothetical protein CYJ37_23860 [Bacillus sp. UMB0728]|nr:hypothetical protein CYJ37_23860 [Bacillus sp. UMB0728]